MTHRFPNTNTTRKGGKHDGSHAKARAAAAQHHQWSDPCARCGHPLGPMGRWLHYDHDDINGGYLGFSHGSQPCPDCGQRCNLRAGAQLGNQRQRAARTQPAPDRQPHSYPIRVTPGGPPPTTGPP